MTSFFLLVSFLLHAIAFISIYHVYEKTKKDKAEQIARLEELMDDFMKNIRHENEKLEKKVYEAEMRRKMSDERALKKNVESDLIERMLNDTNRKEAEINETVKEPKKTWELTNIKAEKEVEDVVETSFEGQVLQLFRAGKSPEEIAKQLNRGKTEVDLYIKLHQLVDHE